jgi:hypothetical protein
LWSGASRFSNESEEQKDRRVSRISFGAGIAAKIVADNKLWSDKLASRRSR